MIYFSFLLMCVCLQKKKIYFLYFYSSLQNIYIYIFKEEVFCNK